MSSAQNVALSHDDGRRRLLTRIAPGLAKLLDYRRADFPHDLVAGLSVAAVALPVGVAYAQLAGFNPAVGLYSSILPLVAYAIFGTSRQLILGPDAATCALVAAAVAPLAGGDDRLYLSLSVTLAFLAGLFSIAASFLRLGALADFLSKPILVGFLNGVALSIMLGQIGKIFGFPITSGGIVPRLVEFVSKLGLTHWPTLAVGLGTFAILALSSRLLPRTPAALVAMIVAAVAVKLLGLEAYGVKAIGEVPAGLPALKIPTFPADLLPNLFEEAAGLALVSFSSMMLTSRSFAAKNRYEVDADREFAALGTANIMSALSQGFAISGADSRTAMSDASGGRTQVTGLVAAAVIAAVLMFFTGPLQYVPIAALGAVLVKAALSLVDLGAVRQLYQMDRREFALSILATLGVVAVGAIQGILVVVALALVQFVRMVSRPSAEVLGEPKDIPGFHALARHPDATTIPGLVLFRFNAPITFFNAAYFKREVMAAADHAGPDLKWFVIDLIAISMIDATGIFAIDDIMATFRERGIVLAAAGRQTEWRQWAEKRHFKLKTSGARIFPTLRAAVKAFRRESANVGEAA
ncbi:MAG TPA: SulP family inorganic anion transporter [Terriglobales bacterium]|nr:SulP family inorganic anion transporter [Terriglobales bacterium]